MIQLTKEQCMPELTEKDGQINQIMMDMAKGGGELIQKIKLESFIDESEVNSE